LGGGFAGAAGGVGLADVDRLSLEGALIGTFGRDFNSFPFVADDEGDGLSGRRMKSSAFRFMPAEVVPVLLVGRLGTDTEEGVNFLESDLVAGEITCREVVGGREVGVPVSMDERTELRN
jgi:hypothetical protein